jgi:phosphomannomutase
MLLLQEHLCLRSSSNQTNAPVVYTPLHGVGLPFVEQAFAAFNLPPPIAVPSQAQPDATFPTTPFPNPEEGATVWDPAYVCGTHLRAAGV